MSRCRRILQIVKTRSQLPIAARERLGGYYCVADCSLASCPKASARDDKLIFGLRGIGSAIGERVKSMHGKCHIGPAGGEQHRENGRGGGFVSQKRLWNVGCSVGGGWRVCDHKGAWERWGRVDGGVGVGVLKDQRW